MQNHPSLHWTPAKLAMAACALLLCAGAALRLGNPQRPAAHPEQSPRPAPLEAYKPQTAKLPREIILAAPLHFLSEIPLSSEAPSLRVRTVRKEVGDETRKGETVIELDDTAAQAELQMAKATLAEAQAKHKQAAETARSARELLDGKAISANQIRQYIASEQIAKANLDNAQAQLELRRIKLSQTLLKAPDNGIVSEIHAIPGTLSGSGPLARIQTSGRMVWKPPIAFEDLDEARQTMAVSIEDGSESLAKARVKEFIASSAGKKQFIAIIPLEPKLLRDKIYSGMTLYGRIKTKIQEPVPLVPLSDIAENTVFIAKPHGGISPVKLAPFQIQEARNGMVALHQAAPGDLVIRAPKSDLLREEHPEKILWRAASDKQSLPPPAARASP